MKAGLISLSTIPSGASVYIGNRRYTQKTPAILRDLLPAEYLIRLNLKNHRPWARAVNVEAGKAAVYEKILLLPQEWKPEQLIPDKLDNLIPMPASHFLILAKGSKLGDYFVYNLDEEKIWSLFSADSPFRSSEVLSCFIQPSRPQAGFSLNGRPDVLFRVDSPQGEKLLWVEFKKGKARIDDLTNLFPPWPFWVEWDPGESGHLFVFQYNYLNRLDIISKAVYPKYLENVRGYGLFDRAIYLVNNDGSLSKMDYDKKNQEGLLDAQILSPDLPQDKSFLQVKIFSKDIILLLGNRGEFFSNRFPYRVVESGVRGFEFYPPSEQVLVWQKDKLGILDFSKLNSEVNSEEGSADKNGVRVSWLFNEGVNIEQGLWVYGGSHILFRDNDKLFLLELKGAKSGPGVNQIIQVKRKSQFFYSEHSGKVYYLNPSGFLSSLEIIPKKEIMLLPFPEIKEKEKENLESEK